MADNVDIKWNMKAFYNIRRLPALIELEERIAQDVADRANEMGGTGDGYRTGSRQGTKRPQGRWRTSVVAASPHAARDNSKHNTLIKALGGAR